MPHSIDLPDDLFARLQKHAIPFVDTPVSVIQRALEALEAGDEDPKDDRREGAPRTFNPAAIPDLKFTSVLSASVDGKALKKSECYWNTVMLLAIVAAAKRGHSTQDILDLLTVNSEQGKREDSGYKFVSEADLSIQGQESNAAWRQAYAVASSFGIEIQLEFAWQDHPKAAMRNQKGSLYVEGK